jgi:hypothetical protein
MRRRALEILHNARDEYRILVDTTLIPLLSDEDRRDLRPILRAFAIQQAAFMRSRWWWGYNVLRLATAILGVAVPIIALVAWIGASATLWAALFAYLLFGAVIALGHGVQQDQQIPPAVFGASAAAVAVGTAVLAAFTAQARYTWLWRGTGLGLAAAVALLALAEVRLYGLLAVRAMVFLPLARRRAGWLLPAQLAATRLVQLLDALHRARASCRHPRRRANFLRWMDRLIKHLQWELPKTTTDLRLGAAITADARTRTDQLTGRLRQLHVRLTHDHQLQEYDRVCTDTAILTMALARGDWSWATTQDHTPPGQRLAVRVAKRLIPAAVLLAPPSGFRTCPASPRRPPAWPGSSSDSQSPPYSASFPSRQPTERTSCPPSPTPPSTTPNAHHTPLPDRSSPQTRTAENRHSPADPGKHP